MRLPYSKAIKKVGRELCVTYPDGLTFMFNTRQAAQRYINTMYHKEGVVPVDGFVRVRRVLRTEETIG